MRTTRILTLAAALAGAAVLASCDSTGPQFGTINAFLTDAPGGSFQSAKVWISKVELVNETDSTIYTITSTPAEYDLLSLQGGVTALLGTATIPAGAYEQLRLIVDSARVVLAPGLTFSNGDTTATLKVPSGMESGIKVNFGDAITIAGGKTDLIVDFDVAQSFVLLGTTDAPTGVLFKPVIHATVQDLTGSIAGTSSPAAAHGQIFAIQGADTVASTFADTTTGAYKLWFLPAGTYTVADSAAGYVTATQSVTVNTSQAVTGVDFTLTAQP